MIVRFLLLSAIFLTSLPSLWAQEQPSWLRYPTISPDGSTIVFTYKGDLYKVAASGGDATQLTFHEAHDFMPVWSKDGKTIAFASDRYGNFDIYTISVSGGVATRLTFHSNDEKPYSFTHDDSHVLFGAVRQDLASHRQFPSNSLPELYQVPVQGGNVDQVVTIPAEYVQVSKDGSTLLYHDKKGGENEWRKHHRSSITRDIWAYHTAKKEHTQLTTWLGEDRNPVFSPDESSIYFLSEESGSFNVHKMNSDGSEREQLTSFETHPVRFLSIGGGTLSFGYDGQIYTMKPGATPQKVSISITTASKSNTDKFIDINGGVQEMALAPNGKEIAFIARGEVFVTSIDGAMTKRITNTAAQERFLTFSPDGKQVVYSSERDGKWGIYSTTITREEEPFFFASTLLEEKPLLTGEFEYYLPAFSPDGKKLAYIIDRRALFVRDLDSGKEVELISSNELYHQSDGDKYFTWSPDSKWLLFEWNKLLNNNDVLLLAADGSKRVNLTPSGYYDYSPKWANEGKQMIWMSNRDGLKSLATSGRFEEDVYTLFFSKEAWDKYSMSEDDYKLWKEIEEATKPKDDDKKKDEKKKDKKKKGDDKADEVKALTFDWDGLEDRNDKLTIHSSFIADAVLSKDGETLYYLSRFEDRYNLWETKVRTNDTKLLINLNTGGGELVWDKDQEELFLLSSGSISKLDLKAGSSKRISIAGEMSYDADKERELMFQHVYNRTKNIFYEPTYHGVDWDFMYQEYQKYVPHTSNGYEFAELLSEMLGELNVSHSGSGYSRSIDNGDQTASLGIFFDYDHNDDGLKIVEILSGGPLDKASFSIPVGSVIERIDGEIIRKDADYARFLNRKVNQFVLLDIVSPKGKRQQLTVKPISIREEQGLLYKRWVKLNEKEVLEKSNGTLGYVHIPGMGDGPYRDIYGDMLGKFYDKKATIVDTRFNGGGDLVADLVMFFTGESFNTYATAQKDIGGEPTSRYTKPTLTMFNEANYSDGHCYAQGYVDMKIGTTLGMPVPGTCSWAGWEGLPNGSYWGVVPVSAKDKSGRWMENLQTEPDIKVKNSPNIIPTGRDEQLEKAIETLMEEVK